MIINKILAPTIHADADPTVTDDDSIDGIDLGVYWFNLTTGDRFICKDVTIGAAVWEDASGGPAGPQGDPGTDLDFSTLDEIANAAPNDFLVVDKSGVKKKIRYTNLQLVLASTSIVYHVITTVSAVSVVTVEIL